MYGDLPSYAEETPVALITEANGVCLCAFSVNFSKRVWACGWQPVIPKNSFRFKLFKLFLKIDTFTYI